MHTLETLLTTLWYTVIDCMHRVGVGRDYLAETFVVKDTHWFTNVSGVEPVMSSHWAGVVPPAT